MRKLEDYTKLQKARLRRYVCYLCEQRLDRAWCAAVWDRCSEEVMAERREDCLRHYKPRVSRALLPLLLVSFPALAQEPDPAQMLARPRLDPVQRQYMADVAFCSSGSFNRRNFDLCMTELRARRNRPVIVAPGGGPGMMMCDTTRIDSDYSTTDCF